jgi:hypothetical protein
MAVTGELTLQETTVSGGIAGSGGGVLNSGLLTVTNSTITDNAAEDGGGVFNGSSSFHLPGGTIIITNSTIAGNAAGYSGGGVANGSYSSPGGTVTITNSTITGNAAEYGGGVANFYFFRNFTFFNGTVTLTRTLVSGNTASSGPEISNSGTVLADNHNLFGVDGTAGVEGFTPGATDIVPPAGVQLADILDPTLAFHGGPTQTHALVPGSPAIDAGGPVCTDATGDPLDTDQRGRPRVVDGNSDGTPACDIGAVEFFPIVNDLVALVGDVDTAFDPTSVANGPAGTFTIRATFTNTSDTPLRAPFFVVTALSGDNLLLNADEGAQGVGATRTPDVGDGVLAPGETVTVDFVIGLHTPERFTFFVDLFGEPLF